MTHKKFVVFKFETYYPGGGLDDIDSSFDSLDDAIAAAKKPYSDNAYIVDRDTWEEVWSE